MRKVLIALAMLFAWGCLSLVAVAHDWHGQPNPWYVEQKVTPQSFARLGFESCCDNGDVYPTRFRVIQDGTKYGKDTWQFERDGQWVSIPDDIIERVETPTGEPVLFVFPYDSNPDVKKGTPVCFKLPPSKG